MIPNLKKLCYDGMKNSTMNLIQIMTALTMTTMFQFSPTGRAPTQRMIVK
ncbi:unnamed protein product [Acanthoscelides obtectus]|uniref:Uncharacterized protein n=1 Tax=Acanthoscelides obtectus TaxID=200917 RepID=A0A9P0MEQ0_ACAOB|nr:unnamed protein product [Acanthoscelides obtectus]CAK1635803.1 hypothetical protein AOBTE_LOCUS9519 [Acanthoscelides obtectus]